MAANAASLPPQTCLRNNGKSACRCPLSTHIKDAGRAICHSRGYIISILQGLEMGWRGMKWCVRGHKNKLTLRKNVQDAKQDEKHFLLLLDSMMRPTFLVEEELRLILFNMSQFGSKISKIKVSTFWILEIRHFPVRGQCQLA